MEMIRSFIAFDMDEEQLRGNLSKAQMMLLETGADLKIVEPENIHITLKFLGDISIDAVDMIHEEMKQVAFTPFDVKIKGLGAFPNLRRIMVIWADIEEGLMQLKNVSGQLESNLRRWGFKSEARGFSPHLTIARVRSGRNINDLARIIQQFENHEFGTMRARCLRLKRSVLTPKGPVYSVLKEVCY